MGQQPNIELDLSDLPRPTPHPDPPRRWSPNRPGELATPDDVPWGGMFGTTGPDPGYALRLVHHRGVEADEGEDIHDVHAAVAAVAQARASAMGRAPTPEDVEVAVLLLGYAPEVPGTLRGWLKERRAAWLPNLDHDRGKTREIIAAIPVDVLTSSLAELRRRVEAGERLLLDG